VGCSSVMACYSALVRVIGLAASIWVSKEVWLALPFLVFCTSRLAHFRLVGFSRWRAHGFGFRFYGGTLWGIGLLFFIGTRPDLGLLKLLARLSIWFSARHWHAVSFGYRCCSARLFSWLSTHH